MVYTYTRHNPVTSSRRQGSPALPSTDKEHPSGTFTFPFSLRQNPKLSHFLDPDEDLTLSLSLALALSPVQAPVTEAEKMVLIR